MFKHSPISNYSSIVLLPFEIPFSLGMAVISSDLYFCYILVNNFSNFSFFTVLKQYLLNDTTQPHWCNSCQQPVGYESRPVGYKSFSCLTHLSMKFLLLIKSKIVKNKDCSCFKTLRCCICYDSKCSNDNNCLHFNFMNRINFMLS